MYCFTDILVLASRDARSNVLEISSLLFLLVMMIDKLLAPQLCYYYVGRGSPGMNLESLD